MKAGTAGWSIPREFESFFPEEGSHLERYSKVFNCVEINSTFNKYHLPRTFEKWSRLTPDNFEFSLKLHRNFTHDSDLNPSSLNLKKKLKEMNWLGEKWKVLLLQFPGKLNFHEKRMARFYKILRQNFSGAIVIEPRNLTWVTKESRDLMKEFEVSKVMADPERCPSENKSILTAGGITYFRLHGSPEIYKSSYKSKFLKDLNIQMSQYCNSWCIFDNTTFGKATGNALTLVNLSP
jgi:uncharacterized protein YecE (DUF72 family)